MPERVVKLSEDGNKGIGSAEFQLNYIPDEDPNSLIIIDDLYNGLCHYIFQKTPFILFNVF